MKLEEYPRPEGDNGRGLHWSASPYHPTELDEWMARLRDMHIRWLKVLDDGGGSSLRLCARLLSEGIMPIVRLYRLQPNPGHIGGKEVQTIRQLVKLGVRYIETNNEPDLQMEWSIPRPLAWLDIVAENWIYDASKCLDAGALPAVPALSIGRQDDLIAAIVAKGGRDALVSGAWVAIHNYTLNHPLDYPDDDVNQRGLPLTESDYKAEGTWAWDDVPMQTINAWRWQDKNPGKTIMDDPACFRSFEFVNAQVVRALGFSLPIISTEGGVVMGWRDDRRYPRITPRLHEQMTVAMFSYMQTAAPDYYFAVCPWLIANFELGHHDAAWESQAWFTNWWNGQFGLQGRLPTVEAVAALPSVSRLEKQGPNHSAIEGNVAAMRGVANLRVTVRREGYSAGTTTDKDGRFRFTGLGAGVYTLQAGGLIKAGLQLDGANTLSFRDLRPPVPVAPTLDWDRRLSELRVIVEPAQAEAGESIWRLVQARLLDASQTGVGAAIFCDVLDELGRPLAGQEVVLSWPTGAGRKSSEHFEAPAHGCEFPISANYDPSVAPGPYAVHVEGLPSDSVRGLGLPLGRAVSFVLIFQRGPAPGATGSTVQGTITQGLTDQPPSTRQAVILVLPDVSTRLSPTDASGFYSFENLPPGLYDLEVMGQGTVVRGIQLDGTNTVVCDYALPAQSSTIQGRVIGGQAGLEVTLRSTTGEVRRTTLDVQGRYRFTLLPAGTYSVSAGDQTVANIILDGLNTVEAPPLDVRPRRGSVGGTVTYTNGAPAVGIAVILTGPEGAWDETTTDAAGAYEFRKLLAGSYTVAVGTIRHNVAVDGLSRTRVDLEVPLEKPLSLAVLFGSERAMGVRVNLRLARRYIRTFSPTVTFRVEEAQQARQVLIVGDLQAVSEADEERLRRSGCVVGRVGGTPYAVEDGLSRLISTRTALPATRSAITVPRRRGGG